MLEVAKIEMSESTQARVAISESTIQQYTAHLEAGGEFPPIEVFFDGAKHWLADGWHRMIAAQRAGRKKIDANINTGTERDAKIHALGANHTHGLPRTNADKRKAVTMALADDVIRGMSTRDIAHICNVSHNLVSEMQKGLSSDDSTTKRKKVSSDDSKPKQQPKETPETPAGTEPPPRMNGELEEAHSTIQDLIEENQRLSDAIAVGKLSEVNQPSAAEIIQALRTKTKALEATIAAITSARDEAMREAAELKVQCQRQAAELKRLKK